MANAKRLLQQERVAAGALAQRPRVDLESGAAAASAWMSDSVSPSRSSRTTPSRASRASVAVSAGGRMRTGWWRDDEYRELH